MRFSTFLLFIAFFTFEATAKHKRRRVRYAFKANPARVIQKRVKRKRRRVIFVPAYFRVYGGLSFSYADAQSGGGPAEGATRNGMAFGAWVEQPISDIFAIETGLAYMQRGVQTEVYQLGELPLQGTVVINNLEVPFRLRANVYRTGRWRVFLSGGMSAGVTLQREANVLGLINVTINDRFETADFMVNASVGAEYRVDRDFKFSIELKNDFGITDIDKSAAVYRTRGHQILFGLGWAFQ